MTPTPLSRRSVLKETVVLAASSVGTDTATKSRRAATQERGALPRARMDSVLRQAVDRQDVAGVVAMAATDKGLLYKGAFGTCVLGDSPVMTLDTVFRIASVQRVTGLIMTQILPFAD